MRFVGGKRSWALLGVVGLFLSGCASAEQMQQFYEPLRAKVNSEAQEVAARVTPAHFERCKQVLSNKNLFGTEFRVDGPFTYNIKMSCHAQDQIFKNYKVAVYEAAKQKVGEGIDFKGKVAACEIRLLPDGTIEVLNGNGNLSGPANSNCHGV